MVSIYHIIGVSIDGDKRVSKDNEGKNAGITPKKDSMLAKLNAIVVDAAQKSDAKAQNDDGDIAKNPHADPAANALRSAHPGSRGPGRGLHR